MKYVTKVVKEPKLYGRCPRCRSTRLVKFGKRWSGGKRRQRYQCSNCGHTTITPKEVC